MLLAGLVAAALCVSIGTLVVRLGLHDARSRADDQRATDRAERDAVTDCLANLEHLINLGVIDLREAHEVPTRPWLADNAISA